MAIRRGPRAKARRQRDASHISAIESGPPETARTIAGAAFQSANRTFARCAEIAELSSSGMGVAIPFQPWISASDFSLGSRGARGIRRGSAIGIRGDADQLLEHDGKGG